MVFGHDGIISVFPMFILNCEQLVLWLESILVQGLGIEIDQTESQFQLAINVCLEILIVGEYLFRLNSLKTLKLAQIKNFKRRNFFQPKNSDFIYFFKKNVRRNYVDTEKCSLFHSLSYRHQLYLWNK